MAINFSINLFGGSIPVSAPQHTFDYLGVPILTPNYSFGIARVAPHIEVNSVDLVQQIRNEFNDPFPANRRPRQAPGLKTIASLDVTNRHYVITFAGITLVDGHRDYDLRLRPVQDPSRYRLREVWVNAHTFETDRIITQGNFASSGLTAIPWTIQFAQIHGTPFIESETTQSRFTVNRRTYDSASVTFSSIRTSQIAAHSAINAFVTHTGSAPDILREP